MTLFAANPNENLLPYDGIVNDFGQVLTAQLMSPMRFIGIFNAVTLAA